MEIIAGAKKSIQIGKGQYYDLENLIVLHGYYTGGLGYSSVRESNGSAGGYQVTSGKTFKCVGLLLLNHNQTSGGHINAQILYGDTDVGVVGTTAPTNGVYEGGMTSGYFNYGKNTSVIENEQNIFFTDFEIPSQKYPCVRANSSLGGIITVKLFGYEV